MLQLCVDGLELQYAICHMPSGLAEAPCVMYL